MENYTFRFLIIVLLCTTGIALYAQSGPECRNLNLGVEPDDSTTIRIADVVRNLPVAIPFKFELLNSFGGKLQEVSVTGLMDSVRVGSCQYLDRGLSFTASNNFGSCDGYLTFKVDATPTIQGGDTTVFCFDPLVYSGVVGSGPEVIAPCASVKPPIKFVADWVKPLLCDPGNDTAKIIYREYEAMGKDGSRGTGFDTIYVRRLPLMTRNNTFCADRDTSYCNVIRQNFGPYMLIPGPSGTACERLYLLNPDGSARQFDPKCGLQISVDPQPFPTDCGLMTRFRVEIKQSCYGATVSNSCPDQDIAANVLTPVGNTPGYWTCDFWSIVLDTTPPVISCENRIKTISASAHGCSAEITLPPVSVSDHCGDVVLVKAMVPGFGVYQFSKSGANWVSTDLISLAHQTDTIQVIYEAYDQCYNRSVDSCGIVVKDLTVPVAIAAKGVNVAMAGKKVWVDAENFDQGSWDNCDIAILLARRTDWKVACLDLCDTLRVIAVSPQGDTILSPVLNDLDEVEAYYQETIKWLTYDSQYCNPLLLKAWQYDLMKYATVECKSTIDESHFDQLAASLFSPGTNLDELKQLGGGWARQVPFSCEDVCSKVKVELLVMDYWCNWSKSWSDALIEDKSAIEIAKEVDEEIRISCRIFRDDGYNFDGSLVSIEDLLHSFDQGDTSVLSEFDKIFGSYQKVWRNNEGELIDSNNNPLVCDIPFVDSMCVCWDSIIPRMVFDYHTSLWVDVFDTVRYCRSEDTTKIFSHGALLINCPENVHCTQTLWHDLNSCGQGVIYRKWSIWRECLNNVGGHLTVPDTTYKTQEIRVINPDILDLGKFQLPPDTVLQACVLEYDPDGSGNVGGGAHPDSIGRPVYLFDSDCSQVGVGYFDKVFELVDTSRKCHAVIRTWCFIDWCDLSEPAIDDWINNPAYAGNVLKYTQHILICEQLCDLNCSALRDTAIACSDIPVDITQLFPFFGTPSIESEDTSIICEFSLQNQLTIDTSECGFGTITNTWFLLNKCNTIVDSCKEVITLLSDSITINRRTFYRGDAEPFNCSDSMILDPVLIVGACPKLGPFTITNDSPFAANNGNNASGNYDVGIHYVHYTITSACLDTIFLTDTIVVIDDVDPDLSAFSDPCVSFMEWETDFSSNPLNPAIRTMLMVTAIENCQLDSIFLINLDSTFFPDSIVKDSVLYTYQWQARDTSGNLSDIEISTLLVSDSCNLNQKNFQYDQSTQEKPEKSNRRVAMASDDGMDDRLLRLGTANIGRQAGEFMLYQNKPNPFHATTTIGFYVPEETDATIRVYDLNGKSIKIVQRHFEKGYHEIDLRRSDLNASGIFYYRFDSQLYTGMRKMILME